MNAANEQLTVRVSRYTGYAHNRYDAYQCSRGILAGMGGTPTADCFADNDDQPDETMDAIYNGEVPMDWNAVFANLEITDEQLDELAALQPGESLTITEYWGRSAVPIVFANQNGTIVATWDDEEKTRQQAVCKF